MLHKLWLTFNDPELEKRFDFEFNQWGAAMDKRILTFTCCLRIAILTRLWLADVDTRQFLATMVVSIPVLLEFIGRKYLERNQPHLLRDWRGTLVAGSRFYMGIFFGRCIPYWLGYAARLPHADTLVQKYPAWLWQFAASGIPLRFALTFGLPLKFAHHFPMMVGMATTISLLTKGHYCKFLTSKSMMPTTRSIFNVSDYVAQFAWDEAGPQSDAADDDVGACPCFRLLAFTNMYWGVCMASYLWWNIEYRIRIRFLRNTIGNTEQVRGVVKMMSLYPWIIATFSIPVFSILWRGSKTIFNIMANAGIIHEDHWW